VPQSTSLVLLRPLGFSTESVAWNSIIKCLCVFSTCIFQATSELTDTTIACGKYRSRATKYHHGSQRSVSGSRLIKDQITNVSRAYASDIFTIIAGPTQEQLLIHEAILGQSPVFRAMTQLPFIEKQERTIRLPDDQASHLRCLIAFLYTSDFTTESEPKYEPRDQESGDDGSRLEFKEAEEAEAEAEAGGYGRNAITRDGSSLPACIVVSYYSQGSLPLGWCTIAL